jgi:hypothetical protein
MDGLAPGLEVCGPHPVSRVSEGLVRFICTPGEKRHLLIGPERLAERQYLGASQRATFFGTESQEKRLNATSLLPEIKASGPVGASRSPRRASEIRMPGCIRRINLDHRSWSIPMLETNPIPRSMRNIFIMNQLQNEKQSRWGLKPLGRRMYRHSDSNNIRQYMSYKIVKCWA